MKTEQQFESHLQQRRTEIFTPVVLIAFLFPFFLPPRECTRKTFGHDCDAVPVVTLLTCLALGLVLGVLLHTAAK